MAYTLEVILKDMSRVVTTFLLSNGGESTGRDTWARGKIERGVIKPIEVMTPTIDKLTLRKIRKMGCQLHDVLATILQANATVISPNDTFQVACEELAVVGHYRTYVVHTSMTIVELA